MSFLSSIISAFNSIGDWFYNGYQEVKGWVWPFYNLAPPLYYVSSFFHQQANFFGTFNTWVVSAVNAISSILSWASIQSLIRSWLSGIESVVSWFASWTSNVTSLINNWWGSTSRVVLGWLTTAATTLQSSITALSTSFNNLKAQVQTLLDSLPSLNELLSWFSDWWGKILAKIISWGALTSTEINSLINSAIAAAAPFWDAWQDVKDKVVAFITDPWTWLVDKFTDWFLGKE